MEKKSLKIVSLFTGCGGLDLGFHLAKNSKYKYDVLWANDILKHACKSFAKNFNLKLYENPTEEITEPSLYCGDIKNFSFKKKLGQEKVDAVIGGFPCQDFSVLRGEGNRGGIKVKRGRLYLHFVRALIELQPKFFVAENVKGLVSTDNGEAFKQIINDFEKLNIVNEEIDKEIGYKIEKNGVSGYKIVHKDVVDFSLLGVPQKRERLIIIGIRKDLISNEEDTKKIEKRLKSLYKNTIFSKFPLTTLEIFHGKSLNALESTYRNIMKSFEENINKINSKRQKEFLKIWNELSFDITKDYLFFNSIKNREGFEEAMKKHESVLDEMGYLNKTLMETKFNDGSDNLLKELKRIKERMAHIPPGENHFFVAGTEHHVTGLMSNIYKRIHPLKTSPTVIANGGGGTWGYHYNINRQRLTNRERARIQTFPDWFSFSGKPSEIRTQLGNAVPPVGIKPFAEELLNIFDKFIKFSD